MPRADGNFCPARDVETLFRPQRGACCSVVDLALNIPAEQIELPRYGFVVRPGSFHLTEQFRCMVAAIVLRGCCRRNSRRSAWNQLAGRFPDASAELAEFSPPTSSNPGPANSVKLPQIPSHPFGGPEPCCPCSPFRVASRFRSPAWSQGPWRHQEDH